MIPYLASSALYSRWLFHRIAGAGDSEAWSKAFSESGASPRDAARTCVAGGGKQPPLILSIPIEGGASRVKKGRPEEWNISLHGRWSAVHLGALEAAYSATPYYPHLIGDLKPILSDCREGENLLNFNQQLHERITDFMQIENLLPQIREEVEFKDGTLKIPELWVKTGHSVNNNSEMTFLDSIFRHGRRALFTLFASLAAWVAYFMPVAAQAAPPQEYEEARLTINPYEGFQRFVDEYGDTVRMTYIREIVVYPPMKFKNKKEEDFYWKTVRDVRKTLPYAKLCYSTLCETYEYIQTIPDQKKREAHLKKLEKDIFERYKPVVKSMTKGQGKILLKLINRETDQSSYHIVKAFLGSFRAGFWQTFGRFFGMNMKAGFNPKKNKEDAIIDRVATLIEQGAL